MADSQKSSTADAFVEDCRVDTAGYLSRHDIYYETPPVEGWEGFPLGNGRLGGPLWAQKEGLFFQINHTDAYEQPDPDQQDEGWAVLRSCGQLIIEHAMPVYDWLSLNDFHGRLSLGTAIAHMQATTAFGDFETTAYIHAQRPVAIFEHKAFYSEAVGENGAPMRIGLERWGSRVFGWWYSGIKGGAGVGLGDCQISVDAGDICMELPFRGVKVALRCRIVGAPTTARVIHNHRAELEVQAAQVQDFRIMLACVTSHESTDPTAAAREALDKVCNEVELAEEHLQWWRDYWQRSFLHVGDDYVENLYYLHLYLMGSAARGHYPPLFNGGLWIWNRDVRNWVNPHHWNQQMVNWCLPAANHCDLMVPYMDTYFRMMPEGQALAKRRGFDGLIWNEMHDFAGRQLGEGSPIMADNLTPASQIAMHFWWHYQFTGDIERLRNQGYPYLREVGDFYLDWVKWNKPLDRYELPITCTYEEYDRLEKGVIPHFTDSITNLAMIQGLFKALLKASEDLETDLPMRERWQHVLDHLPEYQTNNRDTARGVTLASGLLDGKDLPEKENHNHGPLFCPILPAGVLGLKDKGTEIFEAARNTLTTYPTAANCITPTVAVAARLGMSDEAKNRLHTMIRYLQVFPNGMFFNLDWWFIHSRRCNPVTSMEDWLQGHDMAVFTRDHLEDRGCCFHNVAVQAHAADSVTDHFADTPTWPFAQPGLESLGLFACGLQEMLMQSHEGVIHVFPAIPDDWEGAFVLLAAGGFLVESQRVSHQAPSFVAIRSLRGGVLRLVVPWVDGARLWEGENSAFSLYANEQSVSLDTRPGEYYLLAPNGADKPVPSWDYGSVTNSQPKSFQEAMIGKKRNF